MWILCWQGIIKMFGGDEMSIYICSYQVSDKRQAWEALIRKRETCKSGTGPNHSHRSQILRNLLLWLSFKRRIWERFPGNRGTGTNSAHKGHVRKNWVLMSPLKSQNLEMQNLKKWRITRFRNRKETIWKGYNRKVEVIITVTWRFLGSTGFRKVEEGVNRSD